DLAVGVVEVRDFRGRVPVPNEAFAADAVGAIRVLRQVARVDEKRMVEVRAFGADRRSAARLVQSVGVRARRATGPAVTVERQAEYQLVRRDALIEKELDARVGIECQRGGRAVVR